MKVIQLLMYLKLLKNILTQKDSNTGFDMIVGERSGKYYNETVHKKNFRKILKFIFEWTTGTKKMILTQDLEYFPKAQ